MSKGDNSPGMSHLAGIMVGIARDSQNTALVLDFGVIQGDGALLTNTYPIAIPSTDYLVCRGCVLPNSEEIDSQDTTAENQAHRHGFEEGLELEGEAETAGGLDPHSHLVKSLMSEIKTLGSRSIQLSHHHVVDIARPSQRCLKPGDRVLVAWVYNDAVVIDIIKSASEIFGTGDGGYG